MFRNVIIAVGMPRSGTSWLGQIFDSSPDVRFRLSPIFSYAFKNCVDETSSREEYEKLFRGAYAIEDEFMSQKTRRIEGRYPIFVDKKGDPGFLVIKMTRFHNLLRTMLLHCDNLKVVAIVRHPCGAISSWLNTPSEFPASTDPMKEWRTGNCRKTGPEEFWGVDDWQLVTSMHLRLKSEFPSRFTIIRYEDLVDDALNVSEKLFTFFDMPLTNQTEKFLRASQSAHDDDSYAVFKNPAVKDKWRTALHPDIQEEIIRSIQNTELERFLS
ncbi:sulfotransferase [bacterium]|nr:sulfotransferase [bacterium]